MTDISTKQFLKEFNKILKEKGWAGAAAYFKVTPAFVRRVSKGESLPGNKILNRMKLESIKTIQYRYKEV